MKQRSNIRKRIGIIGGGPSGMAAAISAARKGAAVTILERNDRLGKKILSTGNGKCNLGNLDLHADAYYGNDTAFIKQTLERFSEQDTVAFFKKLGLMIKDRNGYLYPASEQASSVLDVLRYELQALGVQVITECKVNHIKKDPRSGEILVSDGAVEYRFDAVILACGSKAAPKTGSDGSGYKLARQLGHSLIPTVPALVQLKCEEDYLKAVAGVRADAEIRVLGDNQAGDGQEGVVAVERGELQLTEYGISGIPVFQLSRQVNYILREKDHVTVEIDFLPDLSNEEFDMLCREREKRVGFDRTVEEFFTGMLNKKIMLLFMKLAGLKGHIPVEEADPIKMKQVYELCKNWRVTVNGSNSYDNAQVCAGGVDTAEVTADFESRLVQGVYIVGELLDVDGKCGGYNLHWAWASGVLAGKHAACE